METWWTAGLTVIFNIGMSISYYYSNAITKNILSCNVCDVRCTLYTAYVIYGHRHALHCLFCWWDIKENMSLLHAYSTIEKDEWMNIVGFPSQLKDTYESLEIGNVNELWKLSHKQIPPTHYSKKYKTQQKSNKQPEYNWNVLEP